MASNTMNFGPEWMRRAPAKTNQSSSDNLLGQDWIQQQPLSNVNSSMGLGSIGAGSGNQGNHGAGAVYNQLPAFSYSSVAAHNAARANAASGGGSLDPAHHESGASDTLNPFKYSKEVMLSLYKPNGLPIEFERHDYVTSEEPLMPMSSKPFSDQEIELLSGSVNSEVARRVTQPGEGVGERSDRPDRSDRNERNGQHRRESVGADQSWDREHGGRHDRGDKGQHSKNHEGKYNNNSNNRSRADRGGVSSDDRHHSFRRQESSHRDTEDGLWNSPVKHTVGSFDTNGVFRVSQEGEELESSVLEKQSEPLEPASSGLTEQKSSDESVMDSSSIKAIGSLSLNRPDFIEEEDESEVALDQAEAKESTLNSGSAFDDQNRGFQFASSSFSPPETTVSPPREPEFNSFGAAAVQSTGFAAAPFERQELSKWLYRDPTGSVQGPFQSDEMHEWYKGGFFSLDLLVKREQDPGFEPLGALIRKTGTDDNPFIVAGVVRNDLPPAPSGRPNLTLAQGRQGLGQFGQSTWGGLSAPATPGTPGFGVDQLFAQQQASHGSNLFNSSSLHGASQLGQSGFEQKWGSGLFGESSNGWSGDAFTRSGNPATPTAQAPLGGGFAEQQRILIQQQIERQQYVQSLHRQVQMQQHMHHQQFLAAQQYYGNDHMALSAILREQQQQQQLLLMRQQQATQQLNFSNPGVATPGGSITPWGGLGQPASPWSTSIIQTNNNDYFAPPSGPNNAQLHSAQSQNVETSSASVERSQEQEVSFRRASVQSKTDEREQEPVQQESVTDNGSLEEIQQQLDQLRVNMDAEKKDVVAPEEQAIEPPQHEEEEEGADEVIEQQEQEEIVEEDVAVPVQIQEPVMADDGWGESPGANVTNDWETDAKSDYDGWGDNADTASKKSEPIESEVIPAPRYVKSVPAPWAKPAVEDESEKKGPTLREIQEIEAKKAEEERAAQKQAALAAGYGDFIKSSSGLNSPLGSSSTPWQTASAPKKTLREIQQEEEAALKRARNSAAAQAAAVGPSTGTGLAAIVASTIPASAAGKRYADTIGPKPANVLVSGGAWSTEGSPKPTPSRSSSYAGGLGASTAPRAPKVETNWIEVESKRPGNSTNVSGRDSHPIPAAAPLVRPNSNVALTPKVMNQILSSAENRPPTEEFMRWARQAFKGLQSSVVLEDFIQMLLTFPLNPDPMTVEIIQDSIYASSQSLDGRRVAEEFVRRRKSDALQQAGVSPAQVAVALPAPATISASNNGGSDDSFKVVVKKGKKKGGA